MNDIDRTAVACGGTQGGQAMDRSPPKGWPRISASVFYDDPARAIDWLEEAFGFETRVKVTGSEGQIVHSELELAEGLIMVGSTAGRPGSAGPRSVGGANTQSLCIFVDDVDAHCARARAAGAPIVTEPEDTDHGDRCYLAEDGEGHRWWFAQRFDEVVAEECRKPYLARRT
jgi:uncharacterized glyoxalase superfamily protein PhnB